MKASATAMDSLLDRAEVYGRSSLELYKLYAIDRTSEFISSIVSRLAVVLAVAFSFVMISIGTALWLCDYFDSVFAGYYFVGGGIALIALILHLFRHIWIKTPVKDAIVGELMKQKDTL